MVSFPISPRAEIAEPAAYLLGPSFRRVGKQREVPVWLGRPFVIRLGHSTPQPLREQSGLWNVQGVSREIVQVSNQVSESVVSLVKSGCKLFLCNTLGQ